MRGKSYYSLNEGPEVREIHYEGNLLDGAQGQDFGHLGAIEGVEVGADAEQQIERHDRSGAAQTLNRDTPLRSSLATSVSSSMAWPDWRSDSTVCCAASDNCINA